MNYIDRRRLKKIAAKAVIQGDHKYKVIKFYEVLIREARAEFTEDNKITLDDFLRECHEEALNVQRISYEKQNEQSHSRA
jgi:hypothetical protein